MKKIHDKLSNEGPALSRELIKVLQDSGQGYDQARKTLSRLAAPAKKLAGVVFPNKSRFYFHQPDFGSERYVDSLSRAMVSENIAAGLAIRGLRARSGTIPKAEFPIACAAPIQSRVGRVRADVVLRQLVDNKIVDVMPDLRHGEIIQLRGYGRNASAKAAHLVEGIALGLLRERLRRMNQVAWGSASIRGEGALPECCGYAWDFVGPSYLSSLKTVTASGVRQGYLVADIILGRTISEDAVEAFLAKVKAVQSQMRGRGFQAMIVFDGDIDQPCLKRLRTHGVVVAKTDELWGAEAAKLLRAISGAIENAAAAIVSDPDRVFKLFQEIASLHGKSLNFHGALFHFMVTHLMSQQGWKVEMSKVIMSSKGKAEIDTQAMRGTAVKFIECKAFLPGNTLTVEDAKHWVEESIPRVKEWYTPFRGGVMPADPEFIMVTSCDVAPDVDTYFKSLAGRHIPVTLWDRARFERELGVNGLNRIRTMFREHFV